MNGMFLSIGALFGKKHATYRQADIFRNLRRQVLTLHPEQIGLPPSQPSEVWGLVMETGYPEAVATIVALGDGTASLYFSNGGGIVGGGQHEGPANAARELVRKATDYISACLPVSEFPLPQCGYTRFYLLTYNGVISATTSESDLGNNRHSLSPLFHAAHALIRQIRILDEARGG